MSEATWLILAGAAATYLIRWGGYAVLSRFRRLPPQIVTGLNAVPTAVLTAIVAPPAMEGGVAEIAALAATALLTVWTRSSSMAFIGGAVTLFAMRQIS